MVSKQHICDRFNKPAQKSAACGNTCIPVPPACKALFAYELLAESHFYPASCAFCV